MSADTPTASPRRHALAVRVTAWDMLHHLADNGHSLAACELLRQVKFADCTISNVGVPGNPQAFRMRVESAYLRETTIAECTLSAENTLIISMPENPTISAPSIKHLLSYWYPCLADAPEQDTTPTPTPTPTKDQDQ